MMLTFVKASFLWEVLLFLLILQLKIRTFRSDKGKKKINSLNHSNSSYFS